MTEPLDIGSEKQLFIDDYCIGELFNARRHFHQAVKHPANPLMVAREPWEDILIQVYGNVLYDPDMQLYRMWYTARGKLCCCVCHATSKDGINWERTQLNKLEHNGVVLTNAVMKAPYTGPTVFRTPEDPDPGRKFRMFIYTGLEFASPDDKRELLSHAHYSVFFSPDGFDWTPYERNPVLVGGDISSCAYDPVTNEYMAFPRTHRTDDGRFRRSVGVSMSKDFVNWGSVDTILSADQVDDARVESRLARFRDLLIYDDPSVYHSDLYGMTGFRYGGLRLGLLWINDVASMRPDGMNDDGVINIQLAYSRHPSPAGYWHRAGDRYDFIPCGNDGDYDCAMVLPAHTVIEHEDELWFYYSGITRSHGWAPLWGEAPPHHPLTKKPELPQSINLATLRRDGFASIEALYPPGRMTTKLLSFDGDRLVINADAEKGHILVELTDHEGRPIPGYTKGECIPFCRDDLRGEIQWNGGPSLTSLKGKPVHIVFHLQTARLYSFKLC